MELSIFEIPFHIIPLFVSQIQFNWKIILRISRNTKKYLVWCGNHFSCVERKKICNKNILPSNKSLKSLRKDIKGDELWRTKSVRVRHQLHWRLFYILASQNLLFRQWCCECVFQPLDCCQLLSCWFGKSSPLDVCIERRLGIGSSSFSTSISASPFSTFSTD